MDTDEAWDKFCKNSTRIQKTSLSEKLDAMMAAINEISTNSARAAQAVPEMMGDEGALGTANDAAQAQSIAPGIPPEMGGSENMETDAMAQNMNPEDQIPGAGADAGLPPEGGAPEMPVGEDVPPMDGDIPPEAEPAPEAPGMTGPEGGEDDEMSDEEIDALLDSLGMGSGAAPAEDVPGEAPVPTAPEAIGSGDLQTAANNLIAALKQAAHKAVDENNASYVVELSQVEQKLSELLGGMVNLTEPDTTAGPVEEAEPLPEAEDSGEGEMPPVDEGAPGPVDEAGSAPVDMESNAPPEAEGESSEEKAPEKDSESDDKKSEDSDKKEEKKDDSDDKKDDDDVKKSADPEDIGDPIADSVNASMSGDSVVKAQTAGPSMKDMMSGKVDMLRLFKSLDEGYVDGCGITPIEGEIDNNYVDENNALLKSDDRIVTARSIFDVKTHSGEKDPDSIVTADDAKSISGDSGEQDPDSINTAKPAKKITGEEDDHEGEKKQVTLERVEMEPGESSDMTIEMPARATMKSCESQGKDIMSLRDMMAIIKSESGKPSAMSTVNGDIVTPEFGIAKSQGKPAVRMGHGVDPWEVIQNDLQEYNVYKSRSTF